MNPYYSDERVTIYHSDSLAIAPDLGFGAVVSDPPYGMAWDTSTSRFSGGKDAARRGGRANQPAIVGDEVPFDPSPWLSCPDVILWGQNHFAHQLPPGSALVWIKRNDPAFGSFLSDAEIAWKKGGRGVYCRRDLSLNGETRIRLHPTQKPVGIMAWCLSFVPSESVVLDPYMGSGTTLVAAKNLGRRAIGVEIEERYCEAAARRLCQNVLDLGGA